MSEPTPNGAVSVTYRMMRSVGSVIGATHNGFYYIMPFLRGKDTGFGAITGRRKRQTDTEALFSGITFANKLERLQAEVYVQDIDSKGPQTRTEAVEQLKNLSKPVAVGILKRLLASKGSPSRIVDHLNALAGLNSDGALDRRLFADFPGHTDPSVRVAGLRALSVYRDDEGFSVLSAALEDPDAEVRRQALNLLCWTYGDRSAGAVLMLLFDADRHVRETAALICGTIELRQSISTLITLLSDADTEVQKQAAESLRKITGKNLGFDHSEPAKSKKEAIEAWRFWWRDNQMKFAV